MKRLERYGFAIGVFGFAILIWFFIMLIPDHLNVNYPLSIETSAKIGDFVGGVVATLFSIAAFLLLYETLNTQKYEIENNQTLLKKQSFESNLFQMINMNNDFVKEFDIHLSSSSNHVTSNVLNNSISITGRDSFRHVHTNYLKNNLVMSRVTNKAYIKEEVFDNLFNNWRDDLSHYFKHSCEIIKFIDQSSIDKSDKCFFMNLFASGLSDSEKALLFYYILFYGNKDFIGVINKYNFFKDLPDDKLIDISHKKWINE